MVQMTPKPVFCLQKVSRHFKVCTFTKVPKSLFWRFIPWLLLNIKWTKPSCLQIKGILERTKVYKKQDQQLFPQLKKKKSQHYYKQFCLESNSCLQHMQYIRINKADQKHKFSLHN